MNVNNLGDVVGIVAIVSAVLGGLVWIIRAQTAMGKQFKPNGGHSMRDSVDRIERDTRDLRHRLDRHIDDHNQH